MSRTNRKNISDGNYREARKGRKGWDWTTTFHGRCRHRGGMLMTEANTGLWSDERGPSGIGRKIDKRRRRRRENRAAMKDQEV